MSTVLKMDRREFLKGVGLSSGALTLGVAIPTGSVLAGASSNGTFHPNAFVSIDKTGLVTIIAHRSEMGQGSKTGLPMIVADEMEADWNRVSVKQGLADKAYGSQNTDGSRSIRRFYQPMRKVGATVKDMLLTAAAQTWSVDKKDCLVANHQVTHKPSGKSLHFGQLVGVAQTLPVPKDVTLKPEKEFRYVGKDVPIVDLEDMVTGQGVYGIDAHVDGMLYAQIERCPVYGGTVKSFDASAALKVKGVREVFVIEHKGIPTQFASVGGVAVIADNTWAAIKGRQQLKIDWDMGENRVYDSSSYRRQLEQAVNKPAKVVRKEGDATAALKATKKRITADYYLPALVHAPMEPPACVAWVQKDKAQVWACVQAPQGVQQVVAGGTGLKPEQVEVNVTLLGGGFGRKSKPDFVFEAAVISKRIGKPVKLNWTREDEVKHGYYHSVSAHHLEAAIDDNKVSAWLHRNAHPSISYTFDKNAEHASDGELSLGFADLPFAIPNIQHENGAIKGHTRIGWLRSVSNIFNVFASGVFVDEIAAARKKDPVDNLLELMGPDRHLSFDESGFKFSNYGENIEQYPYDIKRLKEVTRRAAKNSNWKAKTKEGNGKGICVYRSFLSYISMVVDVSVQDKELKVNKVYCVVDCGRVVNPDRVRSQMEGSIIFGLSLAYYGKITAKEGAIEQSNFHDYPLLRIPQTPEIHIELVQSEELPTGVGEPGVPPVAPALINAIFAATGERIRELPLNQRFSV
ncbi:molybdopterin cofactor-binding domain-containing protein [Pleionea sp. CnH1-48]|uniref:xanthine dehydrogenase family protein molybdopterin-binding subunit n=1 Tax=Pleionea sp. CnH1-48 TaxID=2954494 RepID=UPI00209856EF|nr:molybdopterin cofactor-binding domain-containing protein [Pleionea sp. CnH1-48]MCO7225814.1 molybdopterin-dependent oxidoreductase [Pleionea sp. CnH1-48]